MSVHQKKFCRIELQKHDWRLSMKELILIIIIISLFSSLSYGKNATMQDPELLKKIETNYYSSYPTTIKGDVDVPQQQTTPVASFGDGAENNFMSVSYYSSPDDRIKIKKFISPGNKSGYTLNDGLLVSEEFSCIDQNADRVELAEIIDDDLYVVNRSFYFKKLSGINNIVAYKKGLFWENFCRDIPSSDEYYIFNWNDIPGKDNLSLIKFLSQVYNIGLPSDLIIEKLDNDKRIRIYNSERAIYIQLNNNKTRAMVNFDDGRAVNLTVKNESGKLIVYNEPESYCYLDNSSGRLLGEIYINNKPKIADHNINLLLKNISENYDAHWISNLDNLSEFTNNSIYYISFCNNTTNKFINISINVDNGCAAIGFSDNRNYNINSALIDNCLRLYDLRTCIQCNLTHINTDELFVYSYEIKPKKRGVFYISTIAKTYARPYIEYPMIVDISAKPKFEIYPILGKTKALKEEAIDVVYMIKYVGGSPSSIISDVKIKPDEKPNDYMIEYDKNNGQNFSLFENIEFRTQLTFLKSGIYPLPGIWLNDEYQTFPNINIKINDYWDDTLDLILKYWSILLFLITIVALKRIQKIFLDIVYIFYSVAKLIIGYLSKKYDRINSLKEIYIKYKEKLIKIKDDMLYLRYTT